MFNNSPIQGYWFITPHAVKRYQEIQSFFAKRKLTFVEARNELIIESQKAKPLRQLGETIWLMRGAKPNKLRFHVNFAVTESQPMPQLITVIARTEKDMQLLKGREAIPQN